MKTKVGQSYALRLGQFYALISNSTFGQPGPLAYKLDTLIINRRIEEVSQPVRSTRKIPKIIKLGGMTDICRELGITDSGGNTLRIKISFHQNASTYITPKITYRQSDGSEQTLDLNQAWFMVRLARF